MIQEDIKIKDKYFELTKSLIEHISSKGMLDNKKFVIGICGESGSGKSVTAKCLDQEFNKLDINSLIVHQDSYYKLPPRENHNKRKSDISWVGPNEVKIQVIQDQIKSFKNGGSSLKMPVVNYRENSFSNEVIDIQKITILIVEGVYALELEDLDFTIFLDRSYHDTRSDRMSRTREVYDPFVEEVLEIEHKLVRASKKKADIIVSKDFSSLTIQINQTATND